MAEVGRETILPTAKRRDWRIESESNATDTAYNATIWMND